jgi:hypothetical protein
MLKVITNLCITLEAAGIEPNNEHLYVVLLLAESNLLTAIGQLYKH